MRYLNLLLLPVLFFLTGCVSTTFSEDPALWTYNNGALPSPDTHIKINGLGPCTDNPDRTLHLNSKSPTIILTHGCFASSGRFRALAEVFAFHGQQTACFTYNDRDRMMQSSEELVQAIRELGKAMHNKQFTLIGHSQGGLITRKALVRDRENALSSEELELKLVTISSPFNGIAVASHCGKTWVQVISLGLVIPICYAVSGDKWYEITDSSDFIQKPGTLIPQVSSYLKIVTDENDTCRRRNKEGECLEDDYVFSVPEQYFGLIDNDKRTTNIELPAGHVEIVGDHRIAPLKLISILQSQGLMKRTMANQQASLNNLLAKLYGTKTENNISD